MADKLMYIPSDDTQNYRFCRLKLVAETLNDQLNKSTNQNLISPKKSYSKTLGTSIINIPFSHLSLCKGKASLRVPFEKNTALLSFYRQR